MFSKYWQLYYNVFVLHFYQNVQWGEILLLWNRVTCVHLFLCRVILPWQQLMRIIRKHDSRLLTPSFLGSLFYPFRRTLWDSSKATDWVSKHLLTLHDTILTDQGLTSVFLEGIRISNRKQILNANRSAKHTLFVQELLVLSEMNETWACLFVSF